MKHVLMRDKVVLEGIFDTLKEANYRKATYARYIGNFEIHSMTDKDCRQWINKVTDVFENPKKARGYSNLVKR